jgi:hypothetical protein
MAGEPTPHEGLSDHTVLAVLVLLAASVRPAATRRWPARDRSAERAPVYMSSGSYCVPESPQSAPTVYKPANAQCPAGCSSARLSPTACLHPTDVVAERGRPPMMG